MLSYLEDEFASLIHRKDMTNLTLEPRMRNMRYIGELCKFRLVPFGTVFSMLKQLLDEFSGHNVDTACALLETAGRFLILVPESKSRCGPVPGGSSFHCRFKAFYSFMCWCPCGHCVTVSISLLSVRVDLCCCNLQVAGMLHSAARHTCLFSNHAGWKTCLS